jgi:hypothetical protein
LKSDDFISNGPEFSPESKVSRRPLKSTGIIDVSEGDIALFFKQGRVFEKCQNRMQEMGSQRNQKISGPEFQKTKKE